MVFYMSLHIYIYHIIMFYSLQFYCWLLGIVDILWCTTRLRSHHSIPLGWCWYFDWAIAATLFFNYFSHCLKCSSVLLNIVLFYDPFLAKLTQAHILNPPPPCLIFTRSLFWYAVLVFNLYVGMSCSLFRGNFKKPNSSVMSILKGKGFLLPALSNKPYF